MARHRLPSRRDPLTSIFSPRLDWARDGRDWPLRASSRFVQAGGLRWHVQCLGAGPQVLLLHGAGAATHTWRGLAPLLAAHFEVLAPDLPGHGFSEPLATQRCSLPGMAHALAHLLAELRFTPRAVLGHSAGAALMLRLALDERWAARELVSLNGALLPFEGAAGLLYAPLARLLSNNPLVPRLAAWQGRNLHAVRRLLAGTGSPIDDTGVALYQRLLGNPGHVASVLAMMANWDLPSLQQDLPLLQCPLLLVAADGDRAVPPRQAARVAALVPGARQQLLQGLGHLSHEEEPHRVAALLRATWAGLTG